MRTYDFYKLCKIPPMCLANHKEKQVRLKNKQSSVYFSQKELATRWNRSESTIKSYRENGIIPFFTLPGSSRPLYPKEKIYNIEEEYLTITKKEECLQKQPVVIKRKKPVSSTDPKKEWRI